MQNLTSILVQAGVPATMATGFAVLIIILVLWEFIWKGIALWYAARNHQRAWFIVMLILHTAGILEILYVCFFRKNKNSLVHTTTVTHSTSVSTPGADATSN
jgi:hypothetical protein